MSDDALSNGVLVRRLLALVWRYRLGTLKVFLLQILILGLGLAIVALTGLGVDELRCALSGAGSSTLPRWWQAVRPEAIEPFGRICLIAGGVLLVAIVRGLLDSYFRVSVDRLVQVGLVANLRAELFDKLQRLSFRFFDGNTSGSIINRVTGDAQSVRMFLDQVLIHGGIIVLSLGLSLVYMMIINLPLTLACMIPIPLLAWQAFRFSRDIQPAYRANRERMDAMVQRFAEGVKGFSVVKGFAREEDEHRRFKTVNEEVWAQKLAIFRKISIFIPSMGVLSQLCQAILLAYGGMLVVRGELALGTGLVAFATLLAQFAQQISGLAAIANSLQESLAGARRVFEVLDMPEEVTDRPNALALETGKVRGHIRFENVGFDHGQDPVLQEISFEAKPGQCVAIFGATGSGKSSLLSLIPRFYDPTAGRITLDGHDLRDLELNSLRRSVGMVFQETFLFKGTVAENIAFGSPNASPEQIERAARIAAAHDFIMELPHGYQTVMGEAGITLSGGQRQRLAIARAVLFNPPVLILDDPTAAMDAGTEHEIAEALESALKGRTTFLVAHRVSMLRRADLILVMHRGRIVQVGTHASLSAEPGLYALAMNPNPIEPDALFSQA